MRFKCELAITMGKTVEWLENNLSNREWSIWLDYFSYSPRGASRDDLRFALLYKMIAAFGGSKKPIENFFIDRMLHPPEVEYDPTDPRQRAELQQKIKSALGRSVKWHRQGQGQ